MSNFQVICSHLLNHPREDLRLNKAAVVAEIQILFTLNVSSYIIVGSFLFCKLKSCFLFFVWVVNALSSELFNAVYEYIKMHLLVISEARPTIW
jgi:hypothetical protein